MFSWLRQVSVGSPGYIEKVVGRPLGSLLDLLVGGLEVKSCEKMNRFCSLLCSNLPRTNLVGGVRRPKSIARLSDDTQRLPFSSLVP